MRTEDKISRGSKRLSWLLRHGAEEARLPMDAAGWVALATVQRAVHLSREEILEVVRLNNKSRLQVQGERIRACQGHSLEGMPVTREALEASWERWPGTGSIWHGTTVEAVAGIARDGILAAGRTHVHLAESLHSKVGKRHQVAVLLEVSSARLRELGQEVFRSPNGVLLVREVPPSCLIGLVACSEQARRQEPELRSRLLGEGGARSKESGRSAGDPPAAGAAS